MISGEIVRAQGIFASGGIATVTGTSGVFTDLDVENLTADNLTTTGNLTVSGNLAVSGISEFRGLVTVDELGGQTLSGLTISGATVTGNIGEFGTATISGLTAVSGQFTDVSTDNLNVTNPFNVPFGTLTNPGLGFAASGGATVYDGIFVESGTGQYNTMTFVNQQTSGMTLSSGNGRFILTIWGG